MSTQFSDILDKPATEIDKPKPLPTGTYSWMIQGLPRHDKDKTGNMYEFVEFTCKCTGAADDVDEEALKDWATKSDGTMRNLLEYTARLKFYKTADSVHRLQTFLLDHCMLNGDDKSVRQLIDDSPNAEFLGAITHSASKDGTSVYANIGKTAPMEA